MGNSHLPARLQHRDATAILVAYRHGLRALARGSFVGYNCSPPIGDYNALGCNDNFSRRLLEIIRRL
jgi:hypothetical protein